MKKLTALHPLTILLASSTYAMSPHDDWQSIRAVKDVLLLHPQLASVMGPEGVFNMCATADEFKSLREVKICKKYEMIRHGHTDSETGEFMEYRCINWKKEMVSIPRPFDYATINSNLRPKYNIKVVYPKNNKFLRPVFFKSFTVPECL